MDSDNNPLSNNNFNGAAGAAPNPGVDNNSAPAPNSAVNIDGVNNPPVAAGMNEQGGINQDMNMQGGEMMDNMPNESDMNNINGPVVNEMQEPMEPAAPVPGSIGSSTSVPPNDMPNMTGEPRSQGMMQPAPKKKSNILTIILIVVAILLIGAGVVMAFFLLNPTNKNTAQNTPSTTVEEPAIAEPIVTVLSCSRENNAEKTAKYSGAQTVKESLTAEFSDGSLISYKLVEKVAFETEEQATAGKEVMDKDFADRLATVGLTVDADPFTTKISAKGTTLTFSQTAIPEEINEVNAALLYIAKSSEEGLELTQAVFEEAYKGMEFICSADEDEAVKTKNDETKKTDSEEK